MTDTEYEDYEALITSEGWKRFTEYVEGLWGTVANGGGSMFQSAVAHAAASDSDPEAVAKLRQFIVAQREIQRLLLYPVQRCEQLKPREGHGPQLVGSRRGGL